ncbi:MAG: MlaD family protein [Bacteroidia bacterium]|nr:MlaD family protein [Bacteroidia bacterium]
MMKRTLSRARVGFLIFVGVLTFTVAIFFVGEKSQIFSSVFYVQVNFPNAEGVKPGAYVVLSGYNVGTVSTLKLTPGADSVRLILRIDSDVWKFIKSDSKAEIKQEGLVGNKFINIGIGSTNAARVENYGFVQGVPPFALAGLADNFTAMMDTAKQVSVELNTLLGNLNRGKGTAGRLLHDDALYLELVALTEETKEGIRKTNTQLDQLSKLLANSMKVVDRVALSADTAMANTSKLTAEAASLMEDINAGKGTIGALLKDRELYDSLVTLLSALTDVTYDAGNAADQTAKGIRAMREHWLLGRVFGGEDMESEEPMQSAYVKKMRELQTRLRELEKREERLRAIETEKGQKSGR